MLGIVLPHWPVGLVGGPSLPGPHSPSRLGPWCVGLLLCFLWSAFAVFVTASRPSGSVVPGDRHSSPVVGWVSGLCFSPVCHHSSGSHQGPRVIHPRGDSGRAVLAPEALVSGYSGTPRRPASLSTFQVRSSQSALIPLVPSGAAVTKASCLALIRRLPGKRDSLLQWLDTLLLRDGGPLLSSTGMSGKYRGVGEGRGVGLSLSPPSLQ